MSDSISELRTYLLRCKNHTMVTLFDSLIIGLQIEICRQNARVEMWMQDYNTIRDERAAAFKNLQQAVGNCGLTEYQAECDLEIATRIGALKAERDRLRGALEWYAARRTGERCWHARDRSVIDQDGGRRARNALEDKL